MLVKFRFEIPLTHQQTHICCLKLLFIERTCRGLKLTATARSVLSNEVYRVAQKVSHRPKYHLLLLKPVNGAMDFFHKI